MAYASQESVAATLTRVEREAPFRPAPPDVETLAGPTRTFVIWRGRRWVEVDPATRRRIAK